MQKLASSPPTEAMLPEQYRLADVAFYPVGNQRLLAYAKGTEATRIFHAKFANLLSHCREFKSLDEHLHAYGQGRQLSETALQTIRQELHTLADEGFFIAHSQLRTSLQQAGRQDPLPPMTSMVFPTGNRAAALERCLTSYLDHCQRFDRRQEVVVMDDSASAETRQQYRDMLGSLKARYGAAIAYAGCEEKAAFARRLSEAGEIPFEVVSWACLGDKQYGAATEGANRNALLLHTVGERIFTSDDDIICRVAASPGFKEGLALSSQGSPIEYWFYPDRETALASVHFRDHDLLAQHEQWLGSHPNVHLATYTGAIGLEQASPDFLHHLTTQSGNIVVTTHGVIGDSSWDNTDGFLCQTGETFQHLTSSEQAYRSAITSRETAQVANQVTIVEKPTFSGMHIGGLDNRELLPPFTPVGRSADIAFGHLLAKCFPNHYAVYFPWVLIHAPLETRAYPSQPTLDVPFYEWLSGFISSFEPGLAQNPHERLAKLGDYLDEIGRLPSASFASFTRQIIWQQRGAFVSMLEAQLHTRGASLPAAWRHDAETYCTRVRQSALWPSERFFRGGADLAQRSIVQFAQILKWWPQMVATARRLREDGSRLAQPL